MHDDQSPPVYVSASRFYRQVLGVSWEWASRLRQIGIIEPPAAFCSDGRGRLNALYLLDAAAIERNKARIHNYRRNRARAEHNPSPLCHN